MTADVRRLLGFRAFAASTACSKQYKMNFNRRGEDNKTFSPPLGSQSLPLKFEPLFS